LKKEADINELIEKLRLQSTTNILTKKDAIVIASVSCIYNIGSPHEYGNFVLEIEKGNKASISKYSTRLAELQYKRSEFDFKRGTFRIRGNRIDIYPAYEDIGYRITIEKDIVCKIIPFKPITGNRISNIKKMDRIIIYPAKQYLVNNTAIEKAESIIRRDLKKEYSELKRKKKNIEAERLLKKS